MKLFNFFVAGFLVTSCPCSPLPGEILGYDAIVKASHPNLTDDYKAFTLANGLEVVIHRHDDKTLPMKVAMTVGVGSTGVSRKNPLLTQPIQGLAHLVEHCTSYANKLYTTPYGIRKFVESMGGHQNAVTKRYYTTYEVSFPKELKEGLTRFAHRFISPIFTEELVEAQCKIVHNEWLTSTHMTSSKTNRYAQLLMSKGQPAKLFAAGNKDTFTGNMLEEVQLFWQTHYTADNMKLAISVYKGCTSIENIVLSHFSQIHTSPKNVAPVVLPSSISFWSPESSKNYLQAYSGGLRRSRVYFYWHINCDDGAICADSLNMLWVTIHSSMSRHFANRNYSDYYSPVSYNEYLFRMSFDLRSVELSKISDLRNEVMELLKSIVRVPKFNQSFVKFKSPKNFSVALSKAMFIDLIFKAPLRSHVNYVVNDVSLSLMKMHLNIVIKSSPRVVVAYKSSLMKNVNIEELQNDPFYGIYYQYAPLPENCSKGGLEEKSSPINASKITLTISHDPLPVTHQFLRGLFVEMLLISLKENRIICRHNLEESKFTLQIFLKDANYWEQTMNLVMESFSSLSLHSMETFEKAKMRWSSEIKYSLVSKKQSGEIAMEYAQILTSSSPSNIISLLISDPNPEGASFKNVAAVGRILRQIGVFDIVPYINEKDELIIDRNLITQKVKEMWESGVKADYSATYVQPAPGQTFIYAPSPIATLDSATLILFSLPKCATYLFKKMLFPFFYSRLRYDMQLAYTPRISIINSTYFFISVQSSTTPDFVLEKVVNIIKEIPTYITNMDKGEWVNSVISAGIKDVSIYDPTRGKQIFIKLLKKHLFEESPRCSRVIIQIWNESHCLTRENYVKEMENAAPSTTKLILSISDYPRSADVPEDFKYDDSLLNDFEVVERELVLSPESESPTPAPSSGFFRGLLSNLWGAPAPLP